MKQTQTLLLSSILVLMVIAMAFVGITAYSGEGANAILLLFIGIASPVVTGLMTLVKGQKTLEVSEKTDQKVDQLLNGSMQGKIARLERDVALIQTGAARSSERIGNIEEAIVEISTNVSKLANASDG